MMAAFQDFEMNAPRRHAEGCERVFHLCHEACGTAEVDVRLPWQADLIEHRLRQSTGAVEVDPERAPHVRWAFAASS